MSSTVFKYAVDWVLPGYSGVQVGRSYWVSNLAYAADVTIFGSICEAIQQAFICVYEQVHAVSSKKNTTKTKAML